jgi:hypothetical protein
MVFTTLTINGLTRLFVTTLLGFLETLNANTGFLERESRVKAGLVL